MTPLSRSTRKWWVVVDLVTGSVKYEQDSSASATAISRTMSRRIGSDRALSTPSRRISSRVGCASSRVLVAVFTVFLQFVREYQLYDALRISAFLVRAVHVGRSLRVARYCVAHAEISRTA